MSEQPLRRVMDDRIRLLRLGGELVDLMLEASGLFGGGPPSVT